MGAGSPSPWRSILRLRYNETMRTLAVLALLAVALAFPAAAQTELMVTVTDRKTGDPVTDLTAGDFTVTIDKTTRKVLSCEFTRGLVDVVLMVDSSLLGEQIAPLARSLINELGEDEQMSIVSYHSSADLIEEFTGSRDTLHAALNRIRFGNSPRLLDALYAVAADGFEAATYRRIALLLTSGVDGPSSVDDDEVIRVCRRNRVSVYPVYLMRYGRSQLERIARLTGGAAFNAQQLSKVTQQPAKHIFDVIRGHYRVTLSGNLPLGEDAEIEVRGQKSKKILVSFLELN